MLSLSLLRFYLPPPKFAYKSAIHICLDDTILLLPSYTVATTVTGCDPNKRKKEICYWKQSTCLSSRKAAVLWSNCTYLALVKIVHVQLHRFCTQNIVQFILFLGQTLLEFVFEYFCVVPQRKYNASIFGRLIKRFSKIISYIKDKFLKYQRKFSFNLS